MATGGASPSARKLSFAEARRLVLDAAPALGDRLGLERVPLAACLGRVLAADVIASEPFPRFANSAVDGYAVRVADVARAGEISPVTLPVGERVAAGAAPKTALRPGTAALVMTGAPLPEGTEAVVMREFTDESEREVRIRAAVGPGENLRPAGEDLPRGEAALAAGCVLAPGDLAVLAALGHAEVSVRRRPRVAILSTGDELRLPGEPLAPGEIYDSNSFTIAALAEAAGAAAPTVRRERDDPEAVREALETLLAEHDLVLSLGGVSAGDFDVVKQALAAFPELELWRVGMRPGGPQAFGARDGRVFYGLPGNPVSSAVVFDRLARPLLRRALGARPEDRPTTRATMVEPAPSRAGRRDFLRVRLEGPPEALRARLTGTQSSGAVSSLAKADGLAVVPEEAASVAAGEVLEIVLWGDV